MDDITEINWTWNWTEFCGQPEGFVFWDQQHGDLSDCFQKLVLHFPVLCLICIISGYYCGRHVNYIVRSNFELKILCFRYVLTFLMALMPITRVILEITTTPLHFAPVLILFNVTQCIAWLLHFCYILCLRHRLGPSLRGPVLMNVVWSIHFIITFIALRSQFIIYEHIPSVSNCSIHFYSAIVSVVLQVLYLLTLLPSSQSIGTRYQQFLDSINNDRVSYFATGSYSRFKEDLDPNYLGVAMEGWGPLAKLFFTWVNPLIDKGASEDIKHADDLFDLPLSMSCSHLCQKLDQKLRTDIHLPNITISSRDNRRGYDDESEPSQKEQVYSVSLIKGLFRSFGKSFFGIGILKLAADCFAFLGPLILYRLVSFVENKNEPIEYGYYYASALAISSLASAFCSVHFSFLMSKIKLKIRGALITTIYRKTLTLNSISLNKFSTGEIMNFMSTDTDRVVNLCPSFHDFWGIPFQMGVTIYLLYTHIGPAFISGVIFSCLLIPINKVIASKIGKCSSQLMKEKDDRVNLMSQIIQGIRVIKMHVWEDYFTSKIQGVRESELKYLKYRKYLDALCVFFWATTPVIMSVLTFSTYVLMGGKLNAATVFTCVALLSMLIGPLNAFPWVLNGLTEAWVSIKRIQKLFEVPDLDYGNFYNCVTGLHPGTLVIKDGCFSWGHRYFQLDNININAWKGQFIGIAGQVGSGKSSLLSAILAELEKQNGVIATSELENGIGVVPQSPWLQNGTIRENILFGKAFDQTRYKAVVHACALEEDLEALSGGDETNVGDGGFMLSGGQKARVSLARAVYQDKLLYLLDDVLSAVDNHVGSHIYRHCINGLLKNKTRILVTHQTQYLLSADLIIFLKDGRIEKKGKPSEVLPDYEEHLFSTTNFRDSLEPSTSQRARVDAIRRVPSPSESINDEICEVGSVAFSVYARYWKAVGHLLSFSILFFILCMQVSRNSTDFWLACWVTNEGNSTVVNATEVWDPYEFIQSSETLKSGESYFSLEYLMFVAKHRFTYYLAIYISLCGANCLFTLFRAYSFAYGGVKAAAKMHNQLFSTIIKAKTEFFDLSPLGRILNRFSSDIYTIDDSLPFILNIFLAQTFSLLGALALTVYSLPWLCLIIAPMIPIYLWLQSNYRLASRELKRLSTVTLSPIYSHFSETLAGLSTIRAFRALPRFRTENEEKLENNQKTQLAIASVAAWLQIRLQLMSIAMIIGTGFIAILQHHFDTANPGLVGLAISSALSLTGLLSAVLNVFTETEMELISVERVSQYITGVKSEYKKTRPLAQSPYAWPSVGVVEFHHVELRYREHLMPSLKDICFETRPAERIGVVGRTGSGKSSLFVALFRMVELTSGRIVIDAVNISKLSLKQLRSHLAIIPQNPFLFSGTIRENIDPFNERQNSELWTALQRCHLSHVVRKLGGLAVKLGDGGITLSTGQKQLLCLARAVLHNAKILCIDEATANVDEETDKYIQGTIQTSFRQSTVITIAHRVATIMDSDRVLVMDDGCVKEFDSPQTLLQNKESYFYKLANQDFQ